MEDIKIAYNCANTKSRYDRMNRDFDKEGSEVTEDLDEEKGRSQADQVEENRHRDYFDPETQTVCFSNLRPSEVKSNPTLTIPKPRTVREDAELNSRNTLIERKVSNYVQGLQQQPSNLTISERRGMNKIIKRIEAGEIIICETDKSGKLAVISKELYYQMGESHASNDPIASWEEICKSQRII